MGRRLLLACIAAAVAIGAIGAALTLSRGSSAIGVPASLPPSPDLAGAPSGPSGASAAPGSPPAPDPSPRPTPAPTPSPLERPRVVAALQAALDELRSEAAIPGVSAAIVFGDGSTWAGVSGNAIVASGTPVEPDTAFAAASISKTFVAALILDLSAEGRFAIQDRVGEYLPELALVRTITIRELLDHTSGLHDYFEHPRIDAALLGDRGRTWTEQETLTFVGMPFFPPGTGWQYSNTNYLLLGMLAERVAGRPLAEQLRARYFDPLGLSTAFTQAAEEPRGPVAHGYRFDGPGPNRPPVDLADGSGVVPFRSVVTAAAGAGSVAASARDIARWAHALYNDRATQPGTAALMLADVDRVRDHEPRVPYGLGVQVVTVDGRFETWGHSGRFLGSRSVVRYVPDEDLAIAVMTNQSRVDPAIILARLLRIVAPAPGPCGLCPSPF